MKRTNVIFAASLLVFAIIFASCEKTEETNPLIDASMDDDQVTALYDDVLNEADELTTTSQPSKSSAEYAMMTGSGSRTHETTFSGDTMIKTITYVNFINGNSQNGHVKNGVILIKVLGGPLQEQFKRTITFQNFFIDDIQIEGKKQIEKTAEHQYSIMLLGGKTIFPDGTTYTRECTHTRTWAEGYNTPANIWDDSFIIEGNATGINRKGNTYTHNITNPLVIRNTCRWIVEGTIALVVKDQTAEIDYGMGDCDNIATININGKTTEIRIRTKR